MNQDYSYQIINDYLIFWTSNLEIMDPRIQLTVGRKHNDGLCYFLFALTT